MRRTPHTNTQIHKHQQPKMSTTMHTQAKPPPFPPAEWDHRLLPEFDNDFYEEEDIAAFARALAGPDASHHTSSSTSGFAGAGTAAPTSPSISAIDEPTTASTTASAAISSNTSAARHPDPDREKEKEDADAYPPSKFEFITALNDWRPVYQRARKRRSAGGGSSTSKRKAGSRRAREERREGFVYTILQWPLFLIVMGWLFVLSVAYLLTRAYVFTYEHFVTMRGQRNRLRAKMRSAGSFAEWVQAAKNMDRYLGNDAWKGEDEYAYYNSKTIRTVRDQLRRLRLVLAERHASTSTSTSSSSPSSSSGANSGVGSGAGASGLAMGPTAASSASTSTSTSTRDNLSGNGQMLVGPSRQQIAEDLRTLIEASVKDNFVGTENPHLYSETFYGTKNLVQSYVDEVAKSLAALKDTSILSNQEKSQLFQHLYTNYGRTALCLSGGATFAYYHFGVARALLEAKALPQVITGTSGGALVAALLGTRTDEELKKLLVPALAYKITACSEPPSIWVSRLWRTGARFDSVDWARHCSWFTRGNLTFREAYERTGRILNVTCIPSEPSAPTMLANYLTAPDCVIWSAVLASAAVPGILNPVVLMRKTRAGKLIPYSFGNKWKDGSLRTDIPLKALNTHFNVNFSIVSQVNPHVNLFFFSSRGAVGRPVTHRQGRGWRGGFLGSAIEQYIKLDLMKWLKVLRHLELLPRYFGQDWSEVWLQKFSGTITVWPRVVFPTDFFNILSDPGPERLAGMIRGGQQSTWPKLKFIQNRMAIERGIEEGWRAVHGRDRGISISTRGGRMIRTSLGADDLQRLLEEARKRDRADSEGVKPELKVETQEDEPQRRSVDLRSPSSTIQEKLTGWFGAVSPKSTIQDELSRKLVTPVQREKQRRGSVIQEIGRQSQVFFDDDMMLEGDQDGSNTSASEEEPDADAYGAIEVALDMDQKAWDNENHRRLVEF